MELIQKLAAIQAELKAPKSQFNKFGGYKYRKAEDILEAVKPLLSKYKSVIVCTDELVQQGDRYYIKSIATLYDTEGAGYISATSYAREEDEKKGMDGSQVTGASSSYARKYALNGLLCIDDTADSDTTNQGPQEAPKPKPAPKPAPAPKTAKKTVTDKNIKKLVEWVCNAPDGDLRKERIRMAEESYEWPGNLHEAFLAMIDLSE